MLKRVHGRYVHVWTMFDVLNAQAEVHKLRAIAEDSVAECKARQRDVSFYRS